LCGGVWYKVKEYHHSGRDTQKQKTDGEYYDDLVAFAGEYPVRYIIIDPSAMSFIVLILRNKKFVVRAANNAVLDGLRHVASAIKQGLFRVNNCCVETIKEFQIYSWDDRGNDTPVKESDHHMDADRYFIHTNGIALPKREQGEIKRREGRRR